MLYFPRAVFKFYCWHRAEIRSTLPCFASVPSQSPDSSLRDLRHPPRSLLAPAHGFLSRLCPWLCPEMQIWGWVKMINSKLIILTARLIHQALDRDKWVGDIALLSPECWHCLCGRDCPKLEKQEQNKKHQYSEQFGLFVLRMFASSDICLLPVVRQQSPVSCLRHNSAWQFSWHVTSRLSLSPSIRHSTLSQTFPWQPDSWPAPTLETLLLAASARFCR